LRLSLDKENIQQLTTTDMLKDASTVFYQFPSNVPAESRYNEIFPLRNYVYFNAGSTEIPNRYVQLTQGQSKEDQPVFAPKNLSDRSKDK
jgi:hypothetical protein